MLTCTKSWNSASQWPYHCLKSSWVHRALGVPESEGGMTAAVVKLDALADAIRPSSQNQHLPATVPVNYLL